MKRRCAVFARFLVDAAPLGDCAQSALMAILAMHTPLPHSGCPYRNGAADAGFYLRFTICARLTAPNFGRLIQHSCFGCMPGGSYLSQAILDTYFARVYPYWCKMILFVYLISGFRGVSHFIPFLFGSKRFSFCCVHRLCARPQFGQFVTFVPLVCACTSERASLHQLNAVVENSSVQSLSLFLCLSHAS